MNLAPSTFNLSDWDSNQRDLAIDGVNIFARALDSIIRDQGNVQNTRVLTKSLSDLRLQGQKALLSFDEAGAIKQDMALYNIQLPQASPVWKAVGQYNQGTGFNAELDEIRWIYGKGSTVPGDGSCPVGAAYDFTVARCAYCSPGMPTVG